MKRIQLIAIAWLSGLSIMAQPAPGKLFFGGTLNAYSVVNKSKNGGSTEKDGTTNHMTILPMAGYFLSDRIALGLRLGVDDLVDKTPGGSPDKVSTVTFVINPFARYYLISGTGGLFVEASMNTGIGSTKNYYATNTNTENVTDFSLGVSPGVYYYITGRLAIEAKFGWLGFESNVTKPGEDVKYIQNTFGLKLSPDYFIFGVTYTL